MITLEEFRAKLKASDQIQVNRKTDGCNWFYGKINLFHNRTHWGMNRKLPRVNTPSTIFAGIFSKPWDSYWAGCFTDFNLAEETARKYGGEVEKDWYCDDNNPTWFLIFDDFDKVTKFVYEFEPGLWFNENSVS